ncbi:MAG: 5-formyltetrahydrofolate cyclo-ligase [Deltaproteobacteria bacterium]|nr:5-formyltetrahydrofolate cyclo-ligase [Candidatus Deferrimicrobiaceae bacterium]
MLVAERKAQLRRTERNRMRSCARKEALADASVAAQERLLAAFPPKAGRRVALYAAVGGEVGTERIRTACLAAGALPFYPRIMEDGNLSFYPDGGESDWERGRYGLLEPKVPPGVAGLRGGFDLVVVPGVAFDSRGRRLGKGLGCYDRFLHGLAGTAVTVGLAYSRQLVPEVPVDSWDVPVDAVVTETEVLRVSRKRRKEQTK